jgi:outer membrane protein assembly factor BamB
MRSRRSAVPVVLLAATLLGADWPQFLGPARNGTSAEKGLNWNWPDKGPTVVWSKAVGAGFSGPVVADGKVILFHRVDDDEVIDALDPATGKELWRYKSPTQYRDDFGFDEGPRATPTVAGARVFALGAEGTLSAVELATGKKIWARSLKADYDAPKGYFGIACSPLVVGDKVLVNVGVKGAGIVAFDAATGKELWKATDDAASYSSPALAEFGGAARAVFLTRQGLAIVDPADGAVLARLTWRARLNASVNAATPLVRDDLIFLSSSYNTGAILLRAAKKGESVAEVWKGDDIISNHYNTSVLSGDYLYGIDGRQEAGPRLRCVEFKTGKVVWTKDGFGCAVLTLVDGVVLALTEAGDLVAFDASPKGYKERVRASILSKPCRAAPALADGRLYARDVKKLICVSLKKD